LLTTIERVSGYLQMINLINNDLHGCADNAKLLINAVLGLRQAYSPLKDVPASSAEHPPLQSCPSQLEEYLPESDRPALNRPYKRVLFAQAQRLAYNELCRGLKSIV